MCLYCPRNYWYIMYKDDFINNAINVLVTELLPSQTDKENGSSECNTHSMTTTAAYEMTVLHVPSNVQRLGTKALPGYCKAQPH